MNKQTIITILLTLVAMTTWAQRLLPEINYDSNPTVFKYV